VSVDSRHVEVDAGNRVHLLEQGAGPPVLLLHGSGNPAGFLLPLLRELHGVHVIAPDRPGVGFRRRSRLRSDELRQLAMPTPVIWGEHEPLGSVSSPGQRPS
jgi:hypothetical protein